MNHGEKAYNLFMQGYNCAQAVALAFGDVTGLEEAALARQMASFGGGLGGLREICGALSGMELVAGHLYGYAVPGNDAEKKAHYERVQKLAADFRERTGSILCREILNNPPTDPNPRPRTAEYYAERPCARVVRMAGEILDAYIAENPIPERE